MITEGLYTIGVVSQMTNLSERQIRYYEKQGLVRPIRTPGGRRLFSKKDVSDLIRVKHLLAMGYSVAEIKARWGVDRPKPQETIESPYKTRATKGEDTCEYSQPAADPMVIRETSSGTVEERVSDREGCYKKGPPSTSTVGAVARVRKGPATAEVGNPAQIKGIQGPAVTPAPPFGVRSLYPLRERPRIVEAVDLMRDLEKGSRKSELERAPEVTKKNHERKTTNKMP